jgi:hypothetical protein
MLRRHFSRYSAIRILDIGCGNRSCEITKHWFPRCEYHGVDRDFYAGDSTDYTRMDFFHRIDLEKDALDDLPRADAIILSHVIEHLSNGSEVVAVLCKKLNPGGVIYLEFPSVRSLALPHAYGTLQFCDDETHKRLYSVLDIANTLIANGLKIVYGGQKRDWLRMYFYVPLGLVYNCYYFAKNGRLTTKGGMWDLFGFADCIIGRLPSDH